VTHRRRAHHAVRHLTADLLAMRLARGLTQRAAAEAIGLRQSDISALERGAHSPYLDTVCALADALDCDLILVPRATPSTTA
jgi:transcriptional regulator with XRE-family HTH domain